MKYTAKKLRYIVNTVKVQVEKQKNHLSDRGRHKETENEHSLL